MMRLHLVGTAWPAALVAIPVAAVLVLADSAREHDGVSAYVDPRVAADVLRARTSLLTTLARLLTLVGSEAVVGTLALLMVIFLLGRHGLFLALCAAATMAASAALTVGVKHLVERARPGAVDRLGPRDESYSFPSGHTLNSAVFLGLVLLLVVPMIRARGRRIAAATGTAVLAVGIGLSRVYLGYHWATDIVASWLIAVALLTVTHATIHVGDFAPGSPVRRRSGSRP